MARVVDHLVEKGHRTFAYVGYVEPEYWNRDRLDGTLERLREHGFAIPRRRILHGSLDSMGRILPPLFEGARPDAIICASVARSCRLGSSSGAAPDGTRKGPRSRGCRGPRRAHLQQVGSLTSSARAGRGPG
jgi:hypothetical protein